MVLRFSQVWSKHRCKLTTDYLSLHTVPAAYNKLDATRVAATWRFPSETIKCCWMDSNWTELNLNEWLWMFCAPAHVTCRIINSLPRYYAHIVNVVQPPVRQGGLLLQLQVSTNEQLHSRDGKRVLHKGQALHHNCGHPLEEKGSHKLLLSCNWGNSVPTYYGVCVCLKACLGASSEYHLKKPWDYTTFTHRECTSGKGFSVCVALCILRVCINSYTHTHTHTYIKT